MTKVGTFLTSINPQQLTTSNSNNSPDNPQSKALWKDSYITQITVIWNRKYTRKQQQITSTLTEIFRNKFIFHIIINYLKLLLYSPSLIGRQLSKLAESKEGKAMNKGTFFIMSNIWRLLLQENTPLVRKITSDNFCLETFRCFLF